MRAEQMGPTGTFCVCFLFYFLIIFFPFWGWLADNAVPLAALIAHQD